MYTTRSLRSLVAGWSGCNYFVALEIPTGTAAETEEAELPEVPVVPTSRPGDLWVLGNHRLLCGDATVVTDVKKTDGPAARRHGPLQRPIQCGLRKRFEEQGTLQGSPHPQRPPG